MVITLSPDLDAALRERARREGVSPEDLAVHVLQERLLATAPLQPRDEWERRLLGGSRPWGVSFSDAAVSSEGLYD